MSLSIRRAAFGLLGLTIVYNVLEGLIAIAEGLRAGSIALVGFGMDSYIEVAAASVLIVRLTYRDEETGERMETRALRFIGATFLALAIYVAATSVWALLGEDGADESLVGILLAAASLTVMPLVAVAKLRVARDMGSGALAAEAKETVACSYLSLTLLAGLAANAAFGWWWLDAATALLLTPWLVREGMEGLRGEACHEGARLCWCRSCLYGIIDCRAACCRLAA